MIDLRHGGITLGIGFQWKSFQCAWVGCSISFSPFLRIIGAPLTNLPLTVKAQPKIKNGLKITVFPISELFFHLLWH